jgi:hypothetical protein
MSLLITAIDKYGYFHLTSHLSRANKIEELFYLITNPEWRKGSWYFDASNRLYLKDIDISITSINQYIWYHSKEFEKIELARSLSWLTTLCWISAKIGQQATQVSHFALETLSRLGNIQQTVDRAKNIPDPIRRAKCLIWIGLGAFESGDNQIAKEVWEFSYQLLISLQPDLFDENLEILGDLIYILSLVGEKNRARILAGELENIIRMESERAGGITSNARYAQVKAWASVCETGKVLEFINQFTEPKDQLKALWEAITAQASCACPINDELLSATKVLIGAIHEESQRLQFAEILAVFGNIEQSWKIFDKVPSMSDQSWFLRNYASFLISQFDFRAEENFKLATAAAASIPDSPSRLEHCANLVLGKRRDLIGRNFIAILPIMSEDFDTSLDQLNANTISQISLAFCILGDLDRAGLAAEKAIQLENISEDWDETYAFIEFIKEFGQLLDFNRIEQVLEIAIKRKDLWQKTEMLVALVNSLTGSESNNLQKSATGFLKQISEDRVSLVEHPNTLGSLIVWKSLSNTENLDLENMNLFNQTLIYIYEHDDRADMFAYLALTLSQNGLIDYANQAVDKSLEVLEVEDDPNTLARAASTLTQVAMNLGSKEILDKLENIARIIQDDWLQAEVLFWISGGLCKLGLEEKSRVMFMQAFQQAQWQDSDAMSIEMSWENPLKADSFFSENEYVGWRSTQVAMIYSWLSILLIRPQFWHLKIGTKAIGFISEEYSEKRSLCIHLLASKLDLISNDEKNMIELYICVLNSSKKRHTGELWADLRACFPYLNKHMGDVFIKSTWDNLYLVRNLIV